MAVNPASGAASAAGTRPRTTVSILGSGSTGNATLIENGPTSILVDAGFSGREFERRLRSIGRDPADIDAILVSHEHSDHVLGVGVLARRYGVPVYSNRGTLRRIQKRLVNVEQRQITAMHRFRIGSLLIRPFAVSHDACDPLGFQIEAQQQRIAIATDLGYISAATRECFRDAAVIVIEANYDDLMLWKGSYPHSLKRRIFSIQGHLSNEASARFLAQIITPHTRHVCLAHLSQDNNTPAVARETVERILHGERVWNVPLHVAAPDRVLGPLEI